MNRLNRKPSPALVISVIALFVALGGTGYAATKLPNNSVGTKQLKNNAVTGAKIANAAVTASKIDTKGLTAPNASNAAMLGGQLPSFYLPASSIQHLAPVTLPACTTVSCPGTTLITLGQLTFSAVCQVYLGQQEVALDLATSTDGASWADTTSASSGASDASMSSVGFDEIASQIWSSGHSIFTAVNGEALTASGHVVVFNLFMGQNAQGATNGSCKIGGAFVTP